MKSRNAERRDVRERPQPPAEKQRRRHRRDDDHVRVFGEEEQREAHAAVLGVEAAGQLLLRLGHVERRAVGLGQAADEEDHERDRLHERVPDVASSPARGRCSTMLSEPDIRITLTSVSVTATS